MDDALTLLHTKLAAPVLGRSLVPRPALLARLDAAAHHSLCLVSAPAGSGKTTLAAEWLAARRQRLPAVAWVSLDPGDNDPRRFWRYVFTALQAIDEAAARAALDRLHASQHPDAAALLTPLINDLAGSSGLLGLEDYHTITHPQVHAGLAFLLDHLPPGLRLLILTRSDPPLPLARLRAHSQLAELRAADLRFSLAEAGAFLRQALPHPLAPGLAERLAERTEGWAAGLRLAALALQSRPDPAEQQRFLDTFSGSHRPVLDYLAGEVLAAQPEPVQSFLLHACQLDRLSAPLCDAVLAGAAAPDQSPAGTGLGSAGLLEQLERSNLFIEALDGSGQWYRFHALFAEAMRHAARQRLGEAHLRRMAENASRWYQANAMPGEAIEAALSAQDFARAARLIETTTGPRLVGNEYHTLLRWIDALPAALLQRRPALCLTSAQALLFTTQSGPNPPFERMLSLLALAEQPGAASAEVTAPLPGAPAALRSLILWRLGDFPAAFASARRSLELLPENALEWRGISLIFIGWEAYFSGRLTAALQALIEARLLFQSAGNSYGLLNAILALGEVYTQRLEPQQAGELFCQALRELACAPINPHDVQQRRARALLGLAGLAYERNDLSAAEDDAAQALSLADALGEQELLAQANLLLARLDWAAGRLEPARGRLAALAARLQKPLLLRQVHLWQARLALAAGDLAAVQRWAVAVQEHNPRLPILQQEQEALLLARLHLAQGQPAAAQARLAACLAGARADGRTHTELEARLLLSLAHAAQSQVEQARQSLAQALLLASPAAFLRVYLEAETGAPDPGASINLAGAESQSLESLLQAITVSPLRALPEATAASSAKALTTQAAACLRLLRQARCPSCQAPQPPPAAASATQPAESLPSGEMLSQQEGRVLGLLAAGLSNPEIAQELVVSVNTVKTHVKSVYRKLEVNNRRHARQAARRLHIVA